MKKTLILLLIILSVSCQKENEYFVNLNIDGVTSKLRISLDSIDYNNKIFKIDSIKGTEKFYKFKIPQSLNPKKYSITVLNDSLNQPLTYLVFWFENENIEITVNLANLEETEIKGGSLNEIIKENRNKEKKKFSEMMEELNSAKKPEEIQSIQQKYMGLIQAQRINSIFENPNNLVSLSSLTTMTNIVSTDSLKLYYEQLDENLKNSEYGLTLKKFKNINKLNIGDNVENFSAKDLNGNIVNLSDFKGKIILLDFWASWCVPCHEQNQKEFSKIYDKYKDQNFEIISYSIDKESAKNKWEIASKNDNISWTNLSNLKGVDDPLYIQYGVFEVPTSFIIDQNGVIISKFIGYNSEEHLIENEIKKLLD